MILRSPAENENGGISFHMVPSSTRHSRARGNPGLLRRISLDTRFRGYDGTQAGLLVLIPKRVFSKEDTKSTKERRFDRKERKEFRFQICGAPALWLPLSVVRRARSFGSQISEPFVSFVIFVVNEIKVIVPGYPHRNLKSQNLWSLSVQSAEKTAILHLLDVAVIDKLRWLSAFGTGVPGSDFEQDVLYPL